jgi:hypothetical protein
MVKYLVDDHHHVDGVSLGVRLWTAATNGRSAHPPGDIWAWKPCWNNVGGGKLLIRPPELSGNPSSSHLVAKQKKLSEVNDEFGLKNYICSYLKGIFNM